MNAEISKIKGEIRRTYILSLLILIYNFYSLYLSELGSLRTKNSFKGLKLKTEKVSII